MARPRPARPGLHPVRKDVRVYDAESLPWKSAGREGLSLKPVREDRENGRFFGLVGFEPVVRTGVHQHQGVATSFFLAGGLTDYWGGATLHEAGINLRGATHDAVAYQKTLLVSRLEAPVIYPPDTDRNFALHLGPRFGEIENPSPEMPPEINVAVDRLAPQPTAIAGVTRKMIFDYALSAGEHRYVQLGMLPGSATPAFTTRAPLELWVRAGDLQVGGMPAGANCFVIVEPGATLSLATRYGTLFHAWSEGRADWADADRPARPDLFGF